ncbi:MAG: hypothetical protein IJ877_06810 [Candidatus Gastranaerophilales bacterium]|nr:hypothetical protein [Candidatus Gastranaerophilales bacterium]
MNIDSISNDYSQILQDMVETQSRQIKEAVILEELNMKMAVASTIVDSITSSDTYQMDSVIPENSTVSYHV